MAHFKFNKNGDYAHLDIGSQHFSGGDYSKTKADDLGIVFPYNPAKEIKNGFVVSSLIDHHSDNYHLLKHTEARDCNTIGDDLVYSEMLTASIVIHENELGHKSGAINGFFYGNNEFIEIAYIEAKAPIVMNENNTMMEIYKEFPTITFIDKDNIQEKKYEFKRYDYTNDGWRTPSLFGYDALGYIDDDYDPVIDEKIEKILDKWFEKTKISIISDELYSYLFEYEILSKEVKQKIGGILEFIILDKKYIIKRNENGEISLIQLMGLVKSIDLARTEYKYTKQEIEKDSKRIMKVLEKQYESQ